MGLGFVTGAKLGHRWGLPTTPQSHGHVSMLITWQDNVSVIVFIIKQIGVILKLGLHFTERQSKGPGFVNFQNLFHGI